jgi:hypothetical protein
MFLERVNSRRVYHVPGLLALPSGRIALTGSRPRFKHAARSRQRIEQGPGILQVGRVKALGELGVDWSE